jgi:hypothetical protein
VRQRGVGDPVEQQGAGTLTEQPHRLVNRRQRRGEQGAKENVVEPGHGDVRGDSYPGGLEFPHGADRHLVIGADNGVGSLVARPGEDLADRELAADRGEPAFEGSRHPHPGMPGELFFEGLAPLPGVRCLGRAADVAQPGLAVPFDQVAHQCHGPGAVVGVHDVDARLVGGTGDQRDRDARSQPGQVFLRVDALGDQQPVDLRRDLLQPGVGARFVGGTTEGDQHGPAERAERGFNPAQHLLDEQQPLLLDLRLRAAAFYGDEPDHFLAPADHALGRAVGYVPQGLNDLKDTPPGRRANPVQAVHHPRDGGGGHPRLTRHVV